MTASLLQRLAAADECHVMGPRPLPDRPILQSLKTIAQKGVLSLLLVASASQALASPQAAVIPSQDHSPTAVMVEQHAASFVKTRLTQETNRPQWIRANGNVDAQGMLDTWKEAGVSTANMHELVKVMMITQSPTIARTAQAAVDAQYLSNETAGIFDIQNNEQASEFLEDHSVDALSDQGVVTPETFLTYYSEPSKDISETTQMWERIATHQNTKNKPSLHAQENDTQMAPAKAALLAAVDQAGLSSLTVPLPYWSSSKQIQELADNIVLANQELQKATGWTGPVLGLNGRMGLSIGKPMDSSFAWGFGNGQFHIQADWQDVAHEWVHVLDMAIRVDAGVPPLYIAELQIINHNTTMTKALEEGVVPKEQAKLYSLWGDIDKDLEKAGLQVKKPWHKEVQKKVDSYSSGAQQNEFMKSYYLQTSEHIAYSFGSHVELVVQGSENSALGGAKINHNGDRGPTLQEAAHAAPVWESAMSLTKQQWWNPQMEALAASIASRSDLTANQSDKVSHSVAVNMQERVFLRRSSSPEVGQAVYATLKSIR